MPTVSVASADASEVAADLLALPVFKGGIEGPGTQQVLDALGLDGPTTPDFRGDIGQTLLLAAPGIAARAVLLVGMGRMDELGPARLRDAAGCVARAADGAARIVTTLPSLEPSLASIEAVAEGLLLGAHRDRRFRGSSADPAPTALAEVVLLVPSSLLDGARRAVAHAERVVAAVIAARDLVNLPPDRKRPPALADAIAELAGGACDVRVRDEDALAAEGFGGLLAVGRGSSAPPRLVELTYSPTDPLGRVVLAGKGITFDTGGLSLKRGTHMATMKSDMAGAAAVAAVCSTLAALDVRVAVTGLCALAENMPGSDAQRPDDVLRAYGGTTVEVRDTDAEGRLVLADALAYGATFVPEAMVDLATLTGSVIGALGPYAAGVMGNDQELVGALQAAAAIAGEDVWPLPLWPGLDRFLDTPMADVNNTGDDHGAGSVVGGLFLQRFVGEVPWAHMDIAGPAFLEPELATGCTPAGGTGFGVRTLLAWLERRAA